MLAYVDHRPYHGVPMDLHDCRLLQAGVTESATHNNLNRRPINENTIIISVKSVPNGNLCVTRFTIVEFMLFSELRD